ncbi:MAG: hypothetical protein AAFQ52_05900, partial [Chloroflexota bacterium]
FILKNRVAEVKEYADRDNPPSGAFDMCETMYEETESDEGIYPDDVFFDFCDPIFEDEDFED